MMRWRETMSHIDDERLFAWVDGERSGLTPSEMAAIERHVAECAECGAKVAEARGFALRATEVLDGTGPRVIPVPEFGRLAGSPRSPVDRWRRSVVISLWAASIVGAVGLGWMTRDFFRADQVALFSEASADGSASLESPSADLPPGAGQGVGLAPVANSTVAIAGVAERQEQVGAEVAEAAPPPAAALESRVAAAPALGAVASADATADAARARAPATSAAPPLAASRSEFGAPTAGWAAIDAAEAERRMQRAPLSIPGVRIVGIDAQEIAGESVIRVAQLLDSGVMVTLTQSRARSALSGGGAQPNIASITIERDQVYLLAEAPLDLLTLQVLLERVR